MAVTLDNAAALPAHDPPDGAAVQQPARAEPAIRVWVTLEVGLYVALALLALVLRTAQLGQAPLNDVEAHEALAALRAIDGQVPGKALVAESPLGYVLHALGFTFLGSSDAAARLPVVLGGMLLTLSPVLWRRYLDPLPPLITSLLLTVSPVALLSARTSSPAIWTMLLAVVGSWLALRFVETRAPGWAVAATAAFGTMALLVEPAGLLALVALAFGVGFAWLTEDDPGSEIGKTIRALAAAWPWSRGALAFGAAALVVGTGLFWLPGGLTAIGHALWTGGRGFVERPADTPIAFPLWIALRYETGLLLFGVIGCYRAVREGGFFERALVGWFLAGLVWALAYAGAKAAHALWITLPLSVLVGLMITRWLAERPDMMWRVPAWGVGVHAVITFALWAAVGISVVLLGKLVMFDLNAAITDLGVLARSLTSDIYSRNMAQPEVVTVQDVPVFAYILGNIQLRVLITVLVSLLVGVLFFLVGSLWGARTAWRGLALGTFAYLLLFSAGLGGRAALLAWDDPREFWYRQPVTADLDEMQATLREMSHRATGTPHLLDITTLAPEDGALAWVLRGFPNTRFVSGVGPEIKTAAVIQPVMAVQPAMGADYVGKRLILRQFWDINRLSWRDALMWLYRGESQFKLVPGEEYRLWIRKDVYGVERVE
ncbi:MAG: glycosyltransferase family 39 protein [Anaerolineae bacterium]|nr:glycosyltransferase family 39 protein [Anaerolineae bacterium]